MADPKLTVYHDGSCPLCRVEIAHYRRQVGAEQIAFVDVSQPGCGLGADLDREAAMKRFNVRLPDGTLRSGAAGFATLWQALPAWQRFAGLARLPGVLPAMEVGYRLFLPLRPYLAGILVRFNRRRAGRPGSAPPRTS